MKIIIDSREKDRKQRAKNFYIAKGHDVKVERLDVGDYVFDDQVVFEYKRIDDFMQSIKNKSLFNEAANQALKYSFHYVIIIGELKHFVSSNWRYTTHPNYPEYVHYIYSKYYGAIRRLRTFTTTIEVETEEQAFAEMLLQSEKCLDGKSKYYSNIVRGNKIEGQDAVDVVLGRTKGVGTERIESIRKHHCIMNLYDLLNLSVEDFKQVKGIGESVANNIYEFVHNGEK